MSIRKALVSVAHPLTIYPLLPATLHHQVDRESDYPVTIHMKTDDAGHEIVTSIVVDMVTEETKTPIIGSVVEVMTGKYRGMKGFISFRSFINGYAGGIVEQFIIIGPDGYAAEATIDQLRVL